ncbi:raffinose/stachyose/melibiose transport system substrate-binding protein [Micromonospora pallida]|uniref:Raffinose/stachyose/melibiose transport system substrate-binding protein n=1 Tax=Micromonospora pallida TaxID=145854 RepID=A0A1C6SI29_9ACTN|nr:extracellular solute-binding protein [Micromonospora pallida]SCL28919.1 raffinose/stachyose/melibiose transport system substrate-binding protein [Micromonospora pallida]
MSRRLTSGIAAVGAVALMLTGCSTDAGSSSQSSDKLTIAWKGSEKLGIDAVVEQYKKDFPDREVVVTTADVEQYQATLRTQISAGTAADVVFVWPGDGNPGAIRQIAPGGFLEDLSDHDWVQKYPASLKPLTEVDGKTYLMAPTVTAFGPFYNEAALKETGATAPKVWDEVIPFCKAVKAAGKSAYALGAAALNNTQNPLYSLVPSLVYGADRDFDEKLKSGQTSFAKNEGWQQSMRKYEEMAKAGCFGENATGTTTDQQIQLVASGKSVGMFTIAYQLGALHKAAPNAKFVFTPLTGGNDPNNLLLAASSAGGAAVNAKAKNKKLALEFVDYLASPKVMKIYNDALMGAVPSISTGEAASDENRAVITEYLEAGKTVPFLNQNWPNARVEQAMYAAIQAMLAGEGSSADVLAAMDAEYKRQ